MWINRGIFNPKNMLEFVINLAITFGIDNEQGARIPHYILPSSGRYVIQIEPVEISSDYNLTLSELRVESIEFGQSIKSSIATQSVWKFQGDEGEIVSISVEGTDADLNPIITLLSTEGQEMVAIETDDGQNFVVDDFELPRSEPYLIFINSRGKPGASTMIVSTREQ